MHEKIEQMEPKGNLLGLTERLELVRGVRFTFSPLQLNFKLLYKEGRQIFVHFWLKINLFEK